MKAGIAWAAVAFFVVKFLFGFVGWYSTDDKDPLYRKRLDAVWDRLHERSFFDFVHLVLGRLVQRVRATFRNKWSALGWFIGLSVVGNFLSTFVAVELAIFLFRYSLPYSAPISYSIGDGFRSFFVAGSGISFLFRNYPGCKQVV